MNERSERTRPPDPWAGRRPRIEGLAESCADYLGRITRSLSGELGTGLHYVTDKAHALRDAAALLVDACHQARLDVRRCGADIEATVAEGEAWVEACARPRGHQGPHDARRPATPIERAAAEAHDLADDARKVADLLAWLTGPGGYDHTEDVDDLERGLREVGWSLEEARSAVAALRTPQAVDEAAGGAR